MPADEDFGRLIGDRLRDEIADIHADRDLAGALRGRQSRRTWTIRASIGIPLAAAAAAAVLVVPAGSGVPTPEPGDRQAAPPVSTTTRPQVRNLAQVQALTVQALRSAEEYVIHQKDMLESSYYETWTDRATKRHRMDSYSTFVEPTPEIGPDGKATMPPFPDDGPPDGPLHLTHSIAGEGPMGDVHYVEVNYERRTWHTFHDTEKPRELEVPDILDANSLKKAIDEGRMELIGVERIGDQDTHHLRLFATRRGYQIDLWVDSTSYLPVRETTIVIAGSDEPVMTSDYTWLPRTEQNLAKLELTPPPDFVKE